MKCDNKECEKEGIFTLTLEKFGNTMKINVCGEHYLEIKDMKAWEWITDIS